MSIFTSSVWSFVKRPRLLLTNSDCCGKHPEATLKNCSILLEEHMELRFDELVAWNIDALTTDFATWIATNSINPAATSRVGILSSMECQMLMHQYLEEDICTNLRLLVKTSSLLYTCKDSPHPYISSNQLHLIRSSVGAKTLKTLEHALKTTALAKASKEKLKSLFLILFGSIIAVAYTTTATKDLEEARYELLRILVHHMLFIGERIGLLDCDVTKQRLAGSYHNIWNKTGMFEWTYGAPIAIEGTELKEPSDKSHQLQCLSPGFQTFRDDFRAFITHGENPYPFKQPDFVLFSGEPQTISPNNNLQPQSRADTWQTDAWLDNLGIAQESSLGVMGWSTCSFCNGNLPFDETCSTCFGPFPVSADYGGVALHGNPSSVTTDSDPSLFNPLDINMEASLPHNETKVWPSTTTEHFLTPSHDNAMIQVDSCCSSSEQARRLTEGALHMPEVIVEPDPKEARFGGTKRKLPTLGEETMETTNTNVQTQSKVTKKSSKRPRLTCAFCGVTRREFPSARECDHLRCPNCKVSPYTTDACGREAWTCCLCGDDADPTSSRSQSCRSSLLRCRSCSRRYVVTGNSRRYLV